MARFAVALVAAAPLCYGLTITHHEKQEAFFPKIIYASFTASEPKYLDQVDAQVETWAAKPFRENRYFCVGDEAMDKKPASHYLKTDCGLSMDSLGCKMGYLMVEGAKRGADWLVVTQTDMYINTTMYEPLLTQFDHTQEIAMGPSFGCGCGGYRSGCDEVTQHGGYCGSGVYAISGASIRKMTEKPGWGHFINEMKGYTADGIPEDMVNSCAMHKSGVHMYRFNATYSSRFTSVTGDLKEMRRRHIEEGMYAAHPVTPKMMRWYQALVDGDKKSQNAIERDIGKGGYCKECARESEQTLVTTKSRKDLLALDDPEGLETNVCV